MAKSESEIVFPCLVALLLCSLHLVVGQPDPCVHHIVKHDEFRRSTAYQIAPGEPSLCDARIREGWYRFVGGAGEDMVPCEDVFPTMCGTNKPVCLMDSLPSPTDGVVRKTVCKMSFHGCRRRGQWEIQIKNCGDFRVYRLTSSRGCDSAYCIGTKVKCRANNCSETGYSPCQECPASFPVSPQVKVKTEYVQRSFVRTSVHESKLVFRCEFPPPSTEITYDVHWYINNKPVKVFKNVTAANLETTRLQEEHWPNTTFGMLVNCSVRTRSPGVAVPSHHYVSNIFLAGLEVDKKHIRVEEGKSTKLRVRSTVPPPHYNISGGTVFSNLEVYIFSPKNSTRTVACNGKGEADVAFGHSYQCGVQLNLANYAEGVELEVTGMVDNKYTGERIAHLRLGAGEAQIRKLYWENYTLPDVTVTVVEGDINLSGKFCRSYTDPHLVTADGFSWQYQREGEFILYRHKTYPQAVHVKFQKCHPTSTVTCNCGVAIQAYSSLLVLDRCKGNNIAYTTRHVNYIDYRGCDNKHLVISRTLSSYKVTLPTGTQVTFDATNNGRINSVHVYPSVADIGLSGGLCGEIDGIKRTGDFTLRTGSETTSEEVFAENWRASRTESLFVENPRLTNTAVGRTYCTCDESSLENLVQRANCALEYPVERCSQSDDDFLAPFLHQCGGARSRRDLSLSDVVTDGPSGWQPVERRADNTDNSGTNSRASSGANRRPDSEMTSTPHTADILAPDYGGDFMELPALFSSLMIAAGRPPETMDQRGSQSSFSTLWDVSFGEQRSSEWENGWSESSARAHCQEAFSRAAGISLLEQASGLSQTKDGYLDACVLDIEYSGGTDYTAAAVEDFKEICLEEINRNLTLLATEEGRRIVAEIKNTVCPMDCSGRGRCVNGRCQCHSGFVGHDCGVNKRTPPENLYIPQRGLCNTRLRACRSTPVLADNLPDGSEVFCGFKRIRIRNHGAESEPGRLTTRAGPWMSGQVQCPLPSPHINSPIPDDVLALGYHVSLSNDNQTFSSDVPLVIYDRQCYTCSSSLLACQPTGRCDRPGQA